MNYFSKQIVFREIPDEISLCYLITGCSEACVDCHSKAAWNHKKGAPLDISIFESDLQRLKDWCTTVLFMGGEWEEKNLITFLKLAHAWGFKTALYTGRNSVSHSILECLDYIKTGPYLKKFGGLDAPTTNQKLINLKTGETLNYKFQPNHEVEHDSHQ